MKKLALICTVLIYLVPDGAGQERSYWPGEKINYVVHYGLVNGGVASLDLHMDTLDFL
jgi:hypothetical protein